MKNYKLKKDTEMAHATEHATALSVSCISKLSLWSNQIAWFFYFLLLEIILIWWEGENMK